MMICRLASKLLLLSLLASPGAVIAEQSFWQDATPAARSLNNETTSIRYFNSDEQALRNFLALVPDESSGEGFTIELPMHDGALASYRIVESSIMEDDLAAKFPEIKTFKVNGIDDPLASGRVDISPKGFRAMLQTSQGRVFIDPESTVTGRYIVRMRDSSDNDGSFQCSAGQMVSNRPGMRMSSNRQANRVAGNLMTYRLAVSTTPDYVVAAGGDDASALAEINTAIARVNAIYERDLGISLVLVANNNLLIGGVPDSDVLTLFAQNQAFIDSILDPADYDIGHIFSAPVDFNNAGGIATFRSVCDNSSKAQGATGLLNPTNDIFYIDYVAHEIGHQFGAEHSFNGTTLACGGMNRVPSSAFEPGSGSTIMGYAGICGVEDIQANSDATFHAGSIAQIHAFTGAGGNCNALLATGNTDPVNVNAGVDRTIPLATAFRLEGSGSDTDIPADTLSYQWDQMNAGAATNASTFGDDLGSNALFRSYSPQTSANRDFPALGTQVVDGPYDQSETLPCTTRSLNFRLTVRDGESGQASDDIQINVDGNSGPFRITSHNKIGTNIGQGTPSVVLRWKVANTNIAPVNCANVDIDLLTFSAGHTSYAVNSLLVGTPNDGTEMVTLAGSAALARFRVKCSDNIFYDISDTDIDVDSDPANGSYPVSGNTTFSNPNGLFATSSSCVPVPVVTPVGGGGGGVFDRVWMMFLLGLIGLRRFRGQGLANCS